MQEFEFNVANKLVQVMRMDWGSALASGNGQFMTLEMARSIRWSDALLDDLEFSLKGLLKGYYGGFFYRTIRCPNRRRLYTGHYCGNERVGVKAGCSAYLSTGVRLLSPPELRAG